MFVRKYVKNLIIFGTIKVEIEIGTVELKFEK
jgi:hypothetical protein